MIRFLDPWMLLFAIAAAVPPLLAWLVRREAVAREWAAIEILARAVKRTSLERRLVDWLAVLLRCAMLLAVAFAAARPLFVPSSGPADATARGASAGEPGVLVVGASNGAVVAAIEALSQPGSIVRSIPPGRLDEEPLDATALVVLGDGVVPSSGASMRLQRFIGGGGAAVVLVGPGSFGPVDASHEVRRIAGIAGIGIGGAVDEPAEKGDGEPRRGVGIRIEPVRAGAAAVELPGARVRRRAVLSMERTPPGVAERDLGPPVVLAATSSGGPLAVGRRVGRGAIGVVGVPLEIEGWSGAAWTRAGGSADAWTDLPAWPAVVPFVERTILATRSMAEGVDVATTTATPAVRVGAWLAGTNLAGLAIVLALALAVVDPVATSLTTVFAAVFTTSRSRR